MAFVTASATAQADSPGYAFSANGLDFSLSSYRVMEGGELRHMGHQPIGKASSDLAIHPSGRFVFVVSKTMDTIAVYRLNRDSGELTPVEGSPFRSVVTSPFRLAFHPSGRFVYVAARFTGVGAYSFDEKSGALKPLPDSPYLARERTRSVAVHPSGRFLYAVNSYDNSVSAYVIDQQNGALQEMPNSPFSVGDMGVVDYDALFMSDVPNKAGGIPYNVALDPQGRFAFVTNWAAASVSVFRIEADSGQLVAIEGSPFFTGFNPYEPKVHPNGRILYVTLYSGEIAAHNIDVDSGRLSPVSGSPFTTGAVGPVTLIFNTAGNRVYVPNYETNDVVLLDVDAASGKLTMREAIRTRSGPWGLALVEGDAASLKKSAEKAAQKDAVSRRVKDEIGAMPGLSREAVVVSPSGRHAYAVNRSEALLLSFSIDPETGKATQMLGPDVLTGPEPSDIATDVNGWYLYVTNSGNNTLSAYFIEPKTGVLRSVRGSPVPTGKRPVSVTLDPAARYAFVANAEANTVSVYRYMNGITPLIFESRKYGSPFAAGDRPVAVAVDPTGHFAYVANAGSGDISAYRIHHKIGTLTELPGSPFKAGAEPVALVAHPNGKLLFVANAEAAEIVVFRIERELGAISAALHLKLPASPKDLWLNSDGTELTVLAGKDNKLFYFAVDAEAAALTPKERGAR